MPNLPATLHRRALVLYYTRHDRAKVPRVDAIMKEIDHWEQLCTLLQQKYGDDGPEAAWESSLSRATAQHDYPGDGSGGSLALRQGQRVCVLQRDTPTRGWSTGYVDGVPAPQVGCFLQSCEAGR